MAVVKNIVQATIVLSYTGIPYSLTFRVSIINYHQEVPLTSFCAAVCFHEFLTLVTETLPRNDSFTRLCSNSASLPYVESVSYNKQRSSDALAIVSGYIVLQLVARV